MAATIPVVAGALEPVEEVGYKNRPPLLENVAIEGPLRIPVPHALDTLEQRDAIEEDYNWWRYSKFAAPWLFLLLLLCITILVMTAFQQAGDLRGLRNGRPRYFQLSGISELDNEAGLPKPGVRDLRIAGAIIVIVAAILTFVAFYSKPRPKARKLLYIIYAILLICGAILLWIAFGIAEEDTRKWACHHDELEVLTGERCIRLLGIGTAALATDFILATLAVLAAIALFGWGSDFFIPRIGWRQQERDQELSGKAPTPPGMIKAHGTRKVRVILISIVLLAVILFAILEFVWIVLLHQDHNVVKLRNFRGRTDYQFSDPPVNPYEEEGWPATNTRLRYAWSSIGVLVILVNFIPWRSRIIAYIFAFIYLCVGTMAMVSFGIDVSQLRKTRDLGCPNVPYQNLRDPALVAALGGLPVGLASNYFANQADLETVGLNTKVNCIESPYVAICVIEFIVTVAVIIYLLCEYVLRWSSVHSQRKYPWFQIRKIENELDSRRPVRCELTSQVMTAKEYYYKHRFLAGPTAAGSVIPTGFVEEVMPMIHDVSPFAPTFGAGAYGAPAGLLGAPTYGAGHFISPVIA